MLLKKIKNLNEYPQRRVFVVFGRKLIKKLRVGKT